MVIKIPKNDSSKKSTTVWVEYFSASERVCLGLSENILDYWALSDH